MGGILFDARVIRPGMTGIGTYTRNLLRALPRDRRPIGIILPQGSPFAHDFPGCTLHFTRVQPDSHPLTELYEQFVVPWLCRRHGYTAFVATGGTTPAFHAGFRTYPFVHDLAFLNIKRSHNFRYSLLLRYNLWIMQRYATAILTVSETSRHGIVTRLGVERARTGVVYPADSKLEETPAVPIALPPERPFFLAVSLTNPRKNLSVILEGFRLFSAASGRSHQLVLTGRPDLIREALLRTPVPDAINLGFVGNGELRFLHEHACALIYASLDEGFGIPLVDAARLGCPVICSDIPVFREVMGPHARYFDATSPGALAGSLAAHTASADGARTPVPLRFSWDASAAALLDLVEDPA